ncbi:Type IV pilin PilA [Vibrio cholerae]|uniref:pilin n=1 Tax=Vibrio cholerae TaxID=666 RepID=UPI0011D4344C|nr:pilin [Vibrio cholerae]TXY13207.1 prepilin-type N-terminal cleavage/methylation domain-containing protein [Vibrio cholerae]TXY19890.1 prepilin-type N-terminal cleavage/methylation domain-containing protein [Vibrio cholerae]BCK03975.1 Fimbrial protein [Vibrio cholerae]GHX30634.1 Type IV pilin PilA [Vibrio cholerae]GHY01966.1 Type IV pilin PilA [Vibrio cholerae]
MKAYKNKQQQGFTLIELMIVVAIIGVLAAIAVPAYKDYVKKTEFASALGTMKSLVTPAELYYQEKGSLSAATDTLLGEIGIATSASNLGNITVESGSLVFSFTSSAVPSGTKITYTRDATGWKCKTTASGNDTGFIASSCPKAP